jgi:hypothetical protein
MKRSGRRFLPSEFVARMPDAGHIAPRAPSEDVINGRDVLEGPRRSGQHELLSAAALDLELLPPAGAAESQFV